MIRISKPNIRKNKHNGIWFCSAYSQVLLFGYGNSPVAAYIGYIKQLVYIYGSAFELEGFNYEKPKA